MFYGNFLLTKKKTIQISFSSKIYLDRSLNIITFSLIEEQLCLNIMKSRKDVMTFSFLNLTIG